MTIDANKLLNDNTIFTVDGDGCSWITDVREVASVGIYSSSFGFVVYLVYKAGGKRTLTFGSKEAAESKFEQIASRLGK